MIPSHSASRSVHSASSSCKEELRRTGARHDKTSLKLFHSGATPWFSRNSSSVKARTRAAFTRSSSGPRAATFFASTRPTKPLTLEVINHCDANICQRSAGVCINQISNLLLGRIRSSASILISDARYASSATNAVQDSSTPRCVEMILRSRTPNPPARNASAGSSAQKLSSSSTQRSTVETFAIAARLICCSIRFVPLSDGCLIKRSL